MSGSVIVSNGAGSVVVNDQSGTVIADRSFEHIQRDLKQDYGAVGDGSHDDTSAIAAAIADTASTSGVYADESGRVYTVHVPRGRYKLMSQLDPFGKFAAFKGEGKGASSIFAGAAAAQLRFGERGVSGNQAQALRDLTLDGVNVATGPLLYLGRGSEADVSNVNVVNCLGDGVLFEETQNTHLYNVSSQLHGGSGIVFDYGAAGIQFYGFEIGSCGAWAVKTGTHGYADGTAEVGQIGFHGGIFERSIAGSLGLVSIGQGSGFAFTGVINWADGSPLADMIFLKLFKESGTLNNSGVLLDGWHTFHGAGPASGFHTWVSLADGVPLYIEGHCELTGGFKNGVAYGTGGGSVDVHGWLGDLDGGIFGTRLVDTSGTGTNLDAVVRRNDRRGGTLILFHEGARRTYNQYFKRGDAQPQFRWSTDGKMIYGPGGSTAPTGALYSTTANENKFDGWLAPTMGSVLMTKAGTPSDADFPVAPPVGMQVYDTSADKIWVRGTGGTWRATAALT